MKTYILCLTFFAFLISGCTEQSEKPEATGTPETEITGQTTETDAEEKTETDDAQSNQTSGNWVGNYYGTLPCADCPGIETTISLNKDNTYYMKMVYMERNVDPVEEKGGITFEDDGKKIVLTNSEGSSTQYLLGDNMITQLDGDGKEITGDLADSFILKKQQ